MKIDKLFLLLLVLALIAGCGGSSGSSNNTGNPETISISFSTGTPSVVAAKIGSGSFTAQTLTAGKLSLSLPNGTSDFAVAYVCAAPSLPALEHIFEATTADGNSFTLPCFAPTQPDTTGTLSGSVDATAIPEANFFDIAASAGKQSSVAAITPDTSFSLTVPAGNDRVEVLAYSSNSQGLQATTTLVAARNFDNQSVPGALNGGNQVVLGAGDRTTQQPISYNNVPSGYATPITLVDYIMAGGAGGFPISQSSSQYPVLPTGAIKNGDSYTFVANSINSARPTEMMFVATSSPAGPVSFTFPAPWSYSGPTPAPFPTFDFAYTGFTSKAGVNFSTLISWGLTLTTQISVTASANYQNGSTALAIPDLSALPGLVPAPASGTLVIWVSLIEQNGQGTQQPLSNSLVITSVANSGFYTVP